MAAELVGVGDALEVLDEEAEEAGVLGDCVLKFPAPIPAKLGELNCNDLALVMTGTCCCLGVGECFIPSTGDELDSGVRVNGDDCLDDPGCGGFGSVVIGFCSIGDTRIDLLPKEPPPGRVMTGIGVFLGTAFILSTFLTAIVGFTRFVMLFALSMMSLD